MAFSPKARSGARAGRMRAPALVALTLTALAVTPAAAQAAPASSINWKNCYAQFGPLQCATVPVPLDYDHPNGDDDLDRPRAPAGDRPAAADRLAVPQPGRPRRLWGRLRARRRPVPVHRRGPRALRPRRLRPPRDRAQHGAALLRHAERVGAVVLRRSPSRSRREEERHLARGRPPSVGACDRRARSRSSTTCRPRTWRATSTCCARRVGDEKLTYAGVSYGSYLGMTYANLFPDRVRALVVDGVLDPIAWATGRADEAATCRSRRGCAATRARRRRSASSSGSATPPAPDCAFSGGAPRRYAALAAALLSEPVEVTFAGRPTVAIDYSRSSASRWARCTTRSPGRTSRSSLADVEAQAPRASGARLRGSSASPSDPATRRVELLPERPRGLPGRRLLRHRQPRRLRGVVDRRRARRRQVRLLRPPLDVALQHLRGVARRRRRPLHGPVHRQTANPVLVVGNRFDPATRYRGGGRSSTDLLPRSALLTVNGWGHTSLFLSQCADERSRATCSTAPRRRRERPASRTSCRSPRAGPRRSAERRGSRRSFRRAAASARSRWEARGAPQSAAPGSLQDAFDPKVAIDDDGRSDCSRGAVGRRQRP